MLRSGLRHHIVVASSIIRFYQHLTVHQFDKTYNKHMCRDATVVFKEELPHKTSKPIWLYLNINFFYV